MKILRVLFVLVIAGIGLAFVAIPARATVLYDDLYNPISGHSPISSFGPLADSFSTGGSAVSLGDVKVLVSGAPSG